MRESAKAKGEKKKTLSDKFIHRKYQTILYLIEKKDRERL